MPLVPPAFPFSFLLVLVSFALVGGGGYLVWGWYTGALAGISYLVSGVVMVLWALAGRWIALLVLGRAEADPPSGTRSGEIRDVTRPDGTVLRVERYGRTDGPTVVLTHGWGTDSTEWYYAKRALGERFRVLVWDLRGLGASSAPASNDYRQQAMAADLDAVLSLMTGDEPVVLAGHSIGGMTILSLCRDFPERLAPQGRVTGIVLINTTHTTPLATTTASTLFSALRRPVLEPLLYLMVWTWPLMWLGSWLSFFNGTAHVLSWLTGFSGRAPRAQLDFTTLLATKSSPRVLARGVLGMFRYDATATLAAVPVPALVITSEGDRVLVPEVSAYMAATMPHAELLSLRSARHQALLQRHREMNDAVVEFVGRCLAPRSMGRAA